MLALGDYIGITVYVCVYAHIRMHVFECVCVCVGLSVHACVCVYVSMFECVFGVYVCVCMFECVCLNVCVCIHSCVSGFCPSSVLCTAQPCVTNASANVHLYL